MGGGFASLGSAWGSLCPACFVLTPHGGRGVHRSAILLECLSLCPPSNASHCVPQTCTPRHRHTHTKLMHTFTETDTLTYQHTHTHNTRAYMHSGTHTLTHPLLNTLPRACSLAISHTPLVFVLDVRIRQSAVDTPSQSVFLAAVPSLQSLFLSKQNKMKSNTDLI